MPVLINNSCAESEKTYRSSVIGQITAVAVEEGGAKYKVPREYPVELVVVHVDIDDTNRKKLRRLLNEYRAGADPCF